MPAETHQHGAVRVPSAVVPFLAIGTAAVVAGGLIAAVSRPLEWERGPWLAAFLVLVVGVGQAGLGIGQSFVAGGVVAGRVVAVELGLGNVGALAVIAGRLSSTPAVAIAGSLLFAGALAVFARQSSRGRRPRGRLARSYRSLLVVLAASVPVGIFLSWR